MGVSISLEQRRYTVACSHFSTKNAHQPPIHTLTQWPHSGYSSELPQHYIACGDPFEDLLGPGLRFGTRVQSLRSDVGLTTPMLLTAPAAHPA